VKTLPSDQTKVNHKLLLLLLLVVVVVVVMQVLQLKILLLPIADNFLH
jgi:hypothetical protein